MFSVSIFLLLQAPVGAAKPEVWVNPPGFNNGKCFRQLFEHPDQWAETRKWIDVLAYADHQLNRQFTQAEINAWLPMIEKWGLKFGLEVGAVKEWGVTGTKVFNQEKVYWDKFLASGVSIFAMAMDEPFWAVRDKIGETDEYAVEQTAIFMSLVRQNYPTVLLGSIEPYPAFTKDEIIFWIDALQARCQQKGIRGMDFVRLDVNWILFNKQLRGNWQEVKQIENHCRAKGIPFSLIYWAADSPFLKTKGLSYDETWYVGIFRQAYDYAAIGGSPDRYTLSSWIDIPSESVPETADWTFTRSVLDFCRRFVGEPRSPTQTLKATPAWPRYK